MDTPQPTARRSRRVWVGSLVCTLAVTLALLEGQQRPAQSNVCRCDPPINSQARGPGACTRTQDGATFCEIVFPSARTAQEAVQGPLFGSLGGKLPARDILQAAGRLESGEAEGTSQSLVDSIQAAILVAATARPSDASTQQRFRDILTLTSPPDSRLPQPLAESVRRYALEPEAQDEKPVIHPRVATASGARAYDIWSTRGCLAFVDGRFVFLLRRSERAVDCSPQRLQ